MQAILLAGGLGTRLRKVVNDRPKPMALVNEKPFIEYLLNNLKANGFSNIIMAVGYKGSMIEDYFSTGEQLGLSIQYSYEKEQLGTAGAIKNAESFIEDETFLVLNADTYYNVAYTELLELYRKEDIDMALVLRRVTDVSRYGKVTMEDGLVTGFNEKETRPESGLINGGVYLMKHQILDMIPAGQKVSLENETIPALLEKGYPIGAIENRGYFIDIGIPEDYQRFIDDVTEGRI
ncbi:MAG: nucleotidyltransferase family protein [Lachnospiraceae bacterium]|nr:nucleotidyltransferase family protein [Lachnospiraceae bacterium]